jgi:fluoride ion exporter CrcB/FEX
MIGALIGYAIKFTLLTTLPVEFNWGILLGSMILGLIVSLFASRSPEVSKFITVEDFVGGLLIGVAAGIYSEDILNKLKSLF